MAQDRQLRTLEMKEFLELSHKNLCYLACQWLRRSSSRNGPGCSVAVAETGNWVNHEVVDAIGWRPYGAFSGSVLVEVKTSRSDFLADRTGYS